MILLPKDGCQLPKHVVQGTKLYIYIISICKFWGWGGRGGAVC